MKYNYIIHIIHVRGKYYREVFRDTAACGNAAYLDWTEREHLLFRLSKSRKVPLPVRNHIRQIFIGKILRSFRETAAQMEDPGRPLCFILDRRYSDLLADGLKKTLQETFPGSKTIVFFTDLISKKKRYEQIVRQRENRAADLFCTFDPAEAEKYGIRFHNLPFPDLSSRFLPAEEECDVLFIGQKKERWETVLRVWENLTQRGFRCSFFLINVPAEQQKTAPAGICFSDWIPYKELLRREAGSRCLLEIVQSECTGNTLRVNEAVVLGKKLLSNNPHLKNDPLFDPENMFVFEDPEDIPDEFLYNKAGKYAEKLKREMSLQTFLDDMEKELNSMEAE